MGICRDWCRAFRASACWSCPSPTSTPHDGADRQAEVSYSKNRRARSRSKDPDGLLPSTQLLPIDQNKVRCLHARYTKEDGLHQSPMLRLIEGAGVLLLLSVFFA